MSWKMKTERGELIITTADLDYGDHDLEIEAKSVIVRINDDAIITPKRRLVVRGNLRIEGFFAVSSLVVHGDLIIHGALYMHGGLRVHGRLIDYGNGGLRRLA